MDLGWNDNSCFRERRVLCRTTCYLPVVQNTEEEQFPPEILGPVLALLFLGIVIVFLFGLERRRNTKIREAIVIERVQGVPRLDLHRDVVAKQRSSRRPSGIAMPRSTMRSMFLRQGVGNFSSSSVRPPLVYSGAFQPVTMHQQISTPTSNVQQHTATDASSLPRTVSL